MHRTARRTALCPMSGIRTVGVPRGGWHREDTSTGGPAGGDGGSGHDPNAGGTGNNDDAGKAGAGSKPKIDGDFDAERAQRSLTASREAEKAAKARAAAADKSVQDLKDSLAVALGLKPDPKSDPNALAAQAAKELTDTRAELNELRTENALMRLAGKAGGDVEALRDSRGFMKTLADLDPSVSGYDQLVTDAVKAAVKANPKLAAATATGQGSGRRGADHSGGGGGQGRPKDLREAFARKNQT